MENLKQFGQKTRRSLDKTLFGKEFVADLGHLTIREGSKITYQLVRIKGELFVQYSIKKSADLTSDSGSISLVDVKTLQAILDEALRKAEETANTEQLDIKTEVFGERLLKVKNSSVLRKLCFVLATTFEMVLTVLIACAWGIALGIFFGSEILAIWIIGSILGLIIGSIFGLVRPIIKTRVLQIASMVIGVLLGLAAGVILQGPVELWAQMLIEFAGEVWAGIIIGVTTTLPSALLGILKAAGLSQAAAKPLTGATAGAIIGAIAAPIKGMVGSAINPLIVWGVVGWLIWLDCASHVKETVAKKTS